mgnify:CR=1 FL=1
MIFWGTDVLGFFLIPSLASGCGMVCSIVQYLSQCIVFLSMFCISVNVLYFCQCSLFLSMFYISVNVLYISQCSLFLSMFCISLNVLYFSECPIFLSMFYMSLNVLYFSQCLVVMLFYVAQVLGPKALRGPRPLVPRAQALCP